MFGLFSDLYGSVVAPFDGNTKLPVLCTAFSILYFGFSTRLNTLRVFPKQASIDNAVFYTLAVDFISWICIVFIFTDPSEQLHQLLGLCFTPAGPLYMITVFLPQQFLFISALGFRREVPFHAVAYSTFVLLMFVCCYTMHSWYSGMPSNSFNTKVGGSDLVIPLRETCDHTSLPAYSLITITVVCAIILIFRQKHDRISLFLFVWTLTGATAYGNCVQDVPDRGGAILMAELATLIAVKLATLEVKAGDGFDTIIIKYKDNDESEKKIKKVALVLDGFIGPDAVVCGISRSYEAWIHELINQGVEVILYTAYEKSSVENYFDNKLKAYKLEALRMQYVQQVYYATHMNWHNIRLVSRTFQEDKPDVVHVFFDGISPPLFSWACAYLRIPIVSIMHTDVSVLCKTVGLPPFLSFCALNGQKVFASGLESVATRSRSFATLMLERGWKCDHIVKPHVNVDVFKLQEEPELRKELMFGNEGGMLLIYAGRLDPDKRVFELVEILKRVPNVNLCIVGGGALANQLARLHGKENRIYCKPGFVSHKELARYYNAADLHISASQMETLGNTVLESLACGTPVVVPRAQGFVDTVKDNVTGMLWEADNMDDAVRKVTQLRDDPELLSRLADGAEASIKDLKCSTTVKDLINWYLSADEIRRTKTLEFPRLFSSSCVLLGMYFADNLLLGLIQQVIERENEKENAKEDALAKAAAESKKSK